MYYSFASSFAQGFLEAKMRKSLSNWQGRTSTAYPNISGTLENLFIYEICSYCGSKIKIGFLNCQNCGASIKGENKSK